MDSLRLSDFLSLIHDGLSKGVGGARTNSPLLKMEVSEVGLDVPVRVTFEKSKHLVVKVPAIPRYSKPPLNLACIKSKWVVNDEISDT